MEGIKKLSNNELVSNLILLVVGIILTIWPNESLDVAVNLVGSLIIIFGVVNLFMWFTNKANNYASLFVGILATIIGIFVIVKSMEVVSFVHILLGIAVLANGITNLKALFDIKTNTKTWKVLLISAIITTLLGLLLIFKPIWIADIVIRLGGIIMIVASVEGLLITMKMKKMVKEANKLIEEK